MSSPPPLYQGGAMANRVRPRVNPATKTKGENTHVRIL